MPRIVPRLALTVLAILLISCKGADGAAGPAGSQGAIGPQGPAGPQGAGANMATFTGAATATTIDLLLPATATAANLPAFTCYIALSSAGPWIVVPFSTSTGAPICGVVVRSDGRVEIRLRSWIVPSYYYVTAAWK